jgi:GGDEF domain-containing protein
MRRTDRNCKPEENTELLKVPRRMPTVSYGYSIFKGGGQPDFNRILKEADAKMYQFKKNSKPDASDEIFK